jgi:hypothetical protein
LGFVCRYWTDGYRIRGIEDLILKNDHRSWFSGKILAACCCPNIPPLELFPGWGHGLNSFIMIRPARQGVNESLIFLLLGAIRHRQGLATRLSLESLARNIGQPNLDRLQPLSAEPRAMLPNLLAGGLR